MSEANGEAILNSSGGLLAQHREQLMVGSGLSAETIAANGIRSETDHRRLKALLRWPTLPRKLGAALVIPFKRPDGTNGYCRAKFDSPRQRKNSDKPIKYESPRGLPNEVYFPAGVAEVTANPTAELVFTEGEKKALKATQEGFPTVGLVGVYGWIKKDHAELLAVLEQINWRGRKVFIVFDSDIATNPAVLDAESRLAKYLVDRGAVVKVVRLPAGRTDAEGKPGKVGLDDFLVAHGAADLRKLLDTAEDPLPVDAFETRELAKTADPATEAAKLLKSYEQDGVSRLRCWRNTYLWWHNGRYVERSGGEVRSRVVLFMNERYYGLGTQTTNSILDQVKAQSHLPADAEPPSWLIDRPEGAKTWEPAKIIAVKNGLLNLSHYVAGEPHLIPATPRFFTQCALPFAFNPNCGPPNAWMQFLFSLWEDDQESIDLLQEWFGYSLTCDTSQQKILLIVGPKRSGKGTIARVLREIVGAHHYAGPTLGSLATNFGLWPLIGKTVAVIPDARLSGRTDQSAVTEKLLSISGEDPITIDRKHQEPVTLKLQARLAILTNELPRLSDGSGALAGRMLVLRLTNSFYGTEDMALFDKLKGELPEILLWAIEGWRRLTTRGYFVQPTSSRGLIEDMEDLTSPVAQFIRERCIVNPGSRVQVNQLYEDWCDWCEGHGRKEPGTSQSFGRDVRAAVPQVETSNRRDGDARHRWYEGIGLRLNQDA